MNLRIPPALQQYARKFERLSLRERLMVFGASVLAAVFVIFAVAIDPAQTRSRTLTLQMQNQKEEIATLEAQRARLAGPGAEGDALLRARREEVTRRIGEADDTLKSLHKSLVPAQRVNLLLHDVLRAEPGVQLVSLRTLPVMPLLPEPPQTPTSQSAPPPAAAKRDFIVGNVYKHGVEITLRGSYVDLYNYLARLEKSAWRMFWSRARLNAESHPRLTMTVTLYTLSLDKAWMEV